MIQEWKEMQQDKKELKKQDKKVKRLSYKLIGRVLKGNTVDSYVTACSNGTELYLNKEQLAFLAARKQVINVLVSLTPDDVAFSGVGITIDSLPTQRISSDAEVKKVKQKIDKSRSITLTGALMEGRSILGYRVKTSTNEYISYKKDTVIELASQNLVTNAKMIKRGDSKALAGKNFDLTNLKIYHKGDKFDDEKK